MKKNDLLYCYDISLENFTESFFLHFFPYPSFSGMPELPIIYVFV